MNASLAAVQAAINHAEHLLATALNLVDLLRIKTEGEVGVVKAVMSRDQLRSITASLMTGHGELVQVAGEALEDIHDATALAEYWRRSFKPRLAQRAQEIAASASAEDLVRFDEAFLVWSLKDAPVVETNA